MTSRVCASSAPNGSSISRICGRGIKARAIATLCCMPPDNWLGNACSAACRPIRLSSVSARPDAASTSAEVKSPLLARSLRLKRMFCATVSQGNSEYCWNTMARSAPGPVTALPFATISPPV